MNRPYIFCHMMTSLDGKIMGKYMETPESKVAGVETLDYALVIQSKKVKGRKQV